MLLNTKTSHSIQAPVKSVSKQIHKPVAQKVAS